MTGDTSTSARGCVLESITPCGVLTDAAPPHSGCKQASLALPSAACSLNQQSALAELSATQAAAVTARGAPSHGWRACSSSLGSVSWPLRLSLVLGPIICVSKRPVPESAGGSGRSACARLGGLCESRMTCSCRHLCSAPCDLVSGSCRMDVSEVTVRANSIKPEPS